MSEDVDRRCGSCHWWGGTPSPVSQEPAFGACSIPLAWWVVQRLQRRDIYTAHTSEYDGRQCAGFDMRVRSDPINDVSEEYYT